MTVASCADLEITLRRLDGDRAAAGVRFSPPGSDGDVRLADEVMLGLELAKLDELRHDPVEYGALLGRSLFAGDVLSAFAKARQEAATKDVPLRLRLLIAPTAERLHDLCWETLRDPDGGGSLLTTERILFSRFLTSRDWRPVGVSPKADLDALVVVSNPTGLESWSVGGQALAPVDVAGELSRARAGLRTMPVAELASGGTATLAGLIDGLRSGAEVLYLVCHGFLAKGEPQLLMEAEDGSVDRVHGGELIGRLAELGRLPRLVVLASCQSGGSGRPSLNDRALAGLGPRLAELGVPAVVAMQGNVSMKTVEAFMPAFFTELDRDGQIDRAVTVARGKVSDRNDWWMPVLYMRLKSGRLWYEPGFSTAESGYERWPALLNHIRRQRCLPIVGPGLSDSLLGPRESIARRWADRYRFPMAVHDEEDLADVAQYLWATQDKDFPVDELRGDLKLTLDELGADPPEERRELGSGTGAVAAADLDRLVTAAWEAQRRVDPTEPYSVLASMPFPIYVTTQPVGLLTAALRAAGKQPRVDYCRWNDEAAWPPAVYDDDPAFVPSEAAPLVYHLFGDLGIEGSLVLTVDSYLDFLIGITANKASIPPAVLRALSDRVLLFLGFRIDEWAFRVVFRSIMNLQGQGRRRYSHVAAQIDPEGSRTQSAEGARRYLERYLQWSQVDLYWGSSEAFMRDLAKRWQQAGAGP
ncbi:MAG: CHAT domain-containing protein [Acidimicrobiales bacterium]